MFQSLVQDSSNRSLTRDKDGTNPVDEVIQAEASLKILLRIIQKVPQVVSQSQANQSSTPTAVFDSAQKSLETARGVVRVPSFPVTNASIDQLEEEFETQRLKSITLLRKLRERVNEYNQFNASIKNHERELQDLKRDVPDNISKLEKEIVEAKLQYVQYLTKKDKVAHDLHLAKRNIRNILDDDNQLMIKLKQLSVDERQQYLEKQRQSAAVSENMVLQLEKDISKAHEKSKLLEIDIEKAKERVQDLTMKLREMDSF